MNWQELLDLYHQYTCKKDSVTPSGADIVAQWQGSLTAFEYNKERLESFAWPFADLAYVVIRTGVKIPTHEHLSHLLANANQKANHCEVGIMGNQKRLKPLGDFVKLKEIVLEAKQTLLTGDGSAFCEALDHYHQALEKMDLIASHTQALRKKISRYSGLLASKGCGALGADILLAIVNKDDVADFCQWLHEQDITVVQSGQSLASGLSIEVNEEYTYL